MDVAALLQQPVCSQGFAPPEFAEKMEVVAQRLVANRHLSLQLKHQGEPVDAMWFNHAEPLPAHVKLAFRLDAEEWQGSAVCGFWWKQPKAEPLARPWAAGAP